MSLNDLESANLITDALAARDRMFAALQADGLPAEKANTVFKPLDAALARYHFAKNGVIAFGAEPRTNKCVAGLSVALLNGGGSARNCAGS